MCGGASALEVYTCTWTCTMARFYVNLPQIKVSFSESVAWGSALTDIGSSTQGMVRIFWWQPRRKRGDRSDYLSDALVTFPLTHVAFLLGVATASFTMSEPALQSYHHSEGLLCRNSFNTILGLLRYLPSWTQLPCSQPLRVKQSSWDSSQSWGTHS